ncbi:hypothetical protein FocnCong_v000352 [Fusarium oxysporum f. sp. conglutinans]|nr:hypothetical protein FocnCong_v000352 [Fusarium oxysporum f. sp. conglutinans]
MKVTLQLITASLAVSVAAHPQNGPGGRKPSSTTTAAAASSTTAAPGRGAMSSLPFLPTWLFRDSNANKCISTYNNCLITNSSNQSACASNYAACIKGGSSTTGSATSAQTATTTVSSAGGPPTRTFSRPSVSGLAQWWRNEQSIRRCNYAYYNCLHSFRQRHWKRHRCAYQYSDQYPNQRSDYHCYWISSYIIGRFFFDYCCPCRQWCC